MAGGFGGFLGSPWGMLGSALLPGLLGSLVPHDDPRKLRQQAMQLFDTSYLDNEANSIFHNTLGGAGFNQARSDIIGGAQAGQGQLNRLLAQTGLGHSGVGASISAAAGAAPGFAMGKLNAAAWENAMRQAFQNSQMKAQALMGMPMSQGKGMPLFAGGINALLPLLFKMMQDPNQRFNMGSGSQYGGSVS